MPHAEDALIDVIARQLVLAVLQGGRGLVVEPLTPGATLAAGFRIRVEPTAP